MFYCHRQYDRRGWFLERENDHEDPSVEVDPGKPGPENVPQGADPGPPGMEYFEKGRNVESDTRDE